MLKYYSMEIEHKKDYNPSKLSAEISCQNMSILSKQDMERQNDVFWNNFNCDTIFHPQQSYIDAVRHNEHGLLHGFIINKKSCIYKKPNYSNGNWQTMFSSKLEDRPDLFEYQTKAKSNDNSSCDYSTLSTLQLPNNFYDDISCQDGKHFVYTRTFDNNYYSCLI